MRCEREGGREEGRVRERGREERESWRREGEGGLSRMRGIEV